MNNRKNYIVIRQWAGLEPSEPIPTAPMTFQQAIKACIHFERLGYDIVKMEKIGGSNVA